MAALAADPCADAAAVDEAAVAALSVILPVYNAMPYLTVAVRDVLRQELAAGERLELICAWDGGDRDAWDFLVDVAAGLGGAVKEVEPGDADAPARTPAGNPAAAAAPRQAEDEDHPGVARAAFDALSVADVVGAARPEHALTVVRYRDGLNRGQGSAMSLALKQATAPLIAQMEADDARPNPAAFRTMMEALRAERWDGVCSDAVAFGSPSARMVAYVSWQNALATPADLAAARYVEIPALHQTALFARAAVDRVLEATGGCYRDGPHGACDLDTPVDLWWWLEFFRLGLTCGRVASPRSGAVDGLPETAFFGWRQHPRQKTRVHGRLSLENLRRIKVHALLTRFPRHGDVLLTSVGRTVDLWRADLEAHALAPLRVETREWRPSKRTPPPEFPPELLRRAPGVLRLWAYGDANARRRVRLHVPDWDDDLDVFVA